MATKTTTQTQQELPDLLGEVSKIQMRAIDEAAALMKSSLTFSSDITQSSQRIALASFEKMSELRSRVMND